MTGECLLPQGDAAPDVQRTHAKIHIQVQRWTRRNNLYFLTYAVQYAQSLHQITVQRKETQNNRVSSLLAFLQLLIPYRYSLSFVVQMWMFFEP